MHLTLINGPWFFGKRLEFLSQNLGLAYLAACLREAGHEITILDAVAEAPTQRTCVRLKYQTVYRWGLDYPEIVQRIPVRTEAIGITVPFTNNRIIAQELSSAIKVRYPDIPLLLGGVFPSTQPAEALFPAVDYVIRGEGEHAIVAFANGVSPNKIPGFVFRRDGEVAETGPVTFERNPDLFPFPARDLLPMETYVRHSPRGLIGRRSASLISSRGCPFQCNYCSVHPVAGRLWRPRAAERVLEEIDQLVERWQINHLEFEDDNMTIDLDRVKAILNGLIERRKKGIPLTWENPNGIRTETLDEEFVAMCPPSGNRTLYLPVEHGSRDMLKKMNKVQDLEAVERVIGWCGKHGVRTVIFFIVGYPGETDALWREGWEYARTLRRLGATRFEVFIAKPYPGTRLYEECKTRNHLIHPDAENVVYDMDFAGVRTPEFMEWEILRRRRVMKWDLNPKSATLKAAVSGILPGCLFRRLKAIQERWIGPKEKDEEVNH
ncbi:MAG TPA: radical SAM protein [bacterium]|nr:radical SAM protein [bacterium]HQO35392.1 radical SAM protein [bacterium]